MYAYSKENVSNCSLRPRELLKNDWQKKEKSEILIFCQNCNCEMPKQDNVQILFGK
jgi:hypothetical protein